MQTPVLAADRPVSLAELYRQVWSHAHGVRGRLVGALAMLGGSQLLKLAMPWMAAQAINALQLQGQAGLRPAGLWIAAILGLYVLVWALHGPARVIERSVALRVRRQVADALYARVVAAPLSWHDAHHSADVQHRMTQASRALYGFTSSQFIYLQNFINIAGPLVALFVLSQWTGVVAIAGFVLVGVAIVLFDGALMRLAEQENRAERRYAARLLDFVGNISAIASLRLQRATRRLLDARMLEVFEPLRASIVLNEWKWCTVDLLTVALSWALVVVYALFATTGAPAAGGGALLIGSLFMVHQYAQQAAGVMSSMAANYATLARTQTDFASADVIRHAPQTAPRAARTADAAGRTDPHGDWQRIELQHLAFAYPNKERGGIEDATLTLHRGERLALVGPSGSGKSTLLRVLAGLYDAQRGHIAIDGVAQLGRRHAAEWSTLIPQEAEIFEATLLENLTFDDAASDAALARAVHVSALDAVLEGLPQGLQTPISQRGFNLSGGQRQRLALARAVLAAEGSSLLLLDEPTSALDALTEQRVHERLDAAFAGACIVCAVHRMSLLEHFDRVALMVAGRVVDVGTPDELAARQPLFAAMRDGEREAPAPIEKSAA